MHILAKIKFIKNLDVPSVVKNVDENCLAVRSDFCCILNDIFQKVGVFVTVRGITLLCARRAIMIFCKHYAYISQNKIYKFFGRAQCY